MVLPFVRKAISVYTRMPRYGKTWYHTVCIVSIMISAYVLHAIIAFHLVLHLIGISTNNISVNNCLVCWRIYLSVGLDELNVVMYRCSLAIYRLPLLALIDWYLIWFKFRTFNVIISLHCVTHGSLLILKDFTVNYLKLAVSSNPSTKR